MQISLVNDVLHAIIEACYLQAQQPDGSTDTLYNLLTVNHTCFYFVLKFLYTDPQALAEKTMSLAAQGRLEYLLGINSGYVQAVYKEEAFYPPWTNPVTLPTTVDYFQWTRKLSPDLPFLYRWKPKVGSILLLPCQHTEHDAKDCQNQRDELFINTIPLTNNSLTTTTMPTTPIGAARLGWAEVRSFYHTKFHGSKFDKLNFCPLIGRELIPMMNQFLNIKEIEFQMTRWWPANDVWQWSASENYVWVRKFVKCFIDQQQGQRQEHGSQRLFPFKSLGFKVHYFDRNDPDIGIHGFRTWKVFVEMHHLMGSSTRELCLDIPTSTRLTDLSDEILENVEKVELSVDPSHGDHGNTGQSSSNTTNTIGDFLKRCRKLNELKVSTCSEKDFEWARLEQAHWRQQRPSLPITTSANTAFTKSISAKSKSCAPLVSLKKLQLGSGACGIDCIRDALFGFQESLEDLSIDGHRRGQPNTWTSFGQLQNKSINDEQEPVVLTNLVALTVTWQYLKLGGLAQACPNLIYLDLRGFNRQPQQQQQELDAAESPITHLPPLLRTLKLSDVGYVTTMDWELFRPLIYLEELVLVESQVRPATSLRFDDDSSEDSIYSITGRENQSDWSFPLLISATLKGIWARRIQGQLLRVAPRLEKFSIDSGVDTQGVLNVQSFLNFDRFLSSSLTSMEIKNKTLYPTLTKLEILEFRIEQATDQAKKTNIEFWEFFNTNSDDDSVNTQGRCYGGMFPGLKTLSLSRIQRCAGKGDDLLVETAMRRPTLKQLVLQELNVLYTWRRFKEFRTERLKCYEFPRGLVEKRSGCILKSKDRYFTLKE